MSYSSKKYSYYSKLYIVRNSLQDLPYYNDAINYQKLLSGQEMQIEDLTHTPEKTQVSFQGTVREVSLLRIIKIQKSVKRHEFVLKV